MQLPDILQDALRKMTYATQFSRPMVAGVERTMSTIVWPLLYKFPPEQYLIEITLLLNSECDLSNDVFTSQRTDSEVRQYLNALAYGIEVEFEDVGRSNSFVRRHGVWQCVESPEREISLKEGECLPMLHEKVCTWKLLKKYDFNSAYDAFIYELGTYYNKKAMRNTFDMKNVEECVQFSAQRLKAILSISERNLLADYLEKLAHNPQKNQLEDMRNATSIDWMSNTESWDFLLKFTKLLTLEMRNSLS